MVLPSPSLIQEEFRRRLFEPESTSGFSFIGCGRSRVFLLTDDDVCDTSELLSFEFEEEVTHETDSFISMESVKVERDFGAFLLRSVTVVARQHRRTDDSKTNSPSSFLTLRLPVWHIVRRPRPSFVSLDRFLQYSLPLLDDS
jgi:hypothetical protein